MARVARAAPRAVRRWRAGRRAQRPMRSPRNAAAAAHGAVDRWRLPWRASRGFLGGVRERGDVRILRIATHATRESARAQARHRSGRGALVGDALGRGQREPERAALARLALDADPSAVLFDDALADHEPEPRAADLPRRTRVDLLELAEQFRQVACGDAVAVIDDRHAHLALVPGRLDADALARGRELDRVRQQVREHLAHAVRVQHRVRQPGGDLDLEPDAAFLEQRAQVVRRLLDDWFEALALERHGQRR